MLEEAPVSPDDHLEIDAQQIEDVVIVGNLIDIQHQAMRYVYLIHDGTSCSKVVFYSKGENEKPSALADFNEKQNVYVKVYGSVRIFKEERGIVGARIEEIKEHNEITNHLL